MTGGVIITGAASGIGRAVVALLAARSETRMLLVDRDAAGLEAVVAELDPTAAATCVGDLRDPDFCKSVVPACVAAFGGVAALASNAGAIKGAPLHELSLEDFDYLFAINTRPTWLIGKAAYPHLRKSRGSIVATCSVAADHPTPPLGSYAASKAALRMLVRQMAVEWGPDGIRANCVSPGPTFTPMNTGYRDPSRRAERELSLPLRKLGTADDVAQAIVFLMSEAAGHITGQDLAVDGGLGQSVMALSGSGTGQPQKG